MNSNMDFLEYIALGLLSAILFSISALEYFILGNNGKTIDDINRQDYRKATTWAFIGIIVSIALATLASFDLVRFEHIYLIPIITCLGFWFHFHNKASKVIDLNSIRSQYDSSLSEEILNYLKLHQEFVDLSRIYSGCKHKVDIVIDGKILNNNMKLPKSIAKAIEVLKDLSYNQEKVKEVLSMLVEEGKVIEKDGSYRINQPQKKKTVCL